MRGLKLSPALVRSASTLAIVSALMSPGVASAQSNGADAQGNTPTNAQPAATQAATAQAGGEAQNPTTTAAGADEVVVTGIRASLERSIAIKRDSTGIVDAISAEDIGKFPDTNLAESLQRITGVSINRVNGEGSTVTVRGFGPQYNLVTLNGRQLPASSIQAVGGDQNGDNAGGFDRSFDFSNLASEGVKTLEVYKTGRAAVPTGGIGATINIVTRRPLDARESGLNGSIGVKADYDTSADQCIKCGSHVTPEVSGLLSWSNPSQTFGASVFGSYQKRNFSVPSVANNGWNIVPVGDFLTPNGVYVNAATKINNAPTSGYVAVPDDFRYHFSEDSRTRLNGQAMLQFKPSDRFTLTLDAIYVRNTETERRSDQSNWFNRPFDVVTFSPSDHGIATTTYLHETENPNPNLNPPGPTKDSGSEQAYRAQKNLLHDYGANARWALTDNFTVTADGHFGKSSSLPNNPNGFTSTTVAFSSPILAQWGLDQSDKGFPVETLTTNDAAKGNNNGHWDVGDLATQVDRQFLNVQSQKIWEGRLDAGWDLGGGSRFDFGTDYRDTKTHQRNYTTQQTLGDWGNSIPRDLNVAAPGQVNQFCLVCKFTHHDTKASGDDLIAWRTEDATKLYNTLASYYSGKPDTVQGNSINDVEEKIWSAYGQLTWKGELAGHEASLVAGARYEQTKVQAASLQAVPEAIIWTADNDFSLRLSNDLQQLNGKGKYNNLLPSMDFQINLTNNLIGRFSFGRTIARPSYGNLFASTSVSAPGRPTALGGVPGGFQNNPNLDPLISDNFDLSLEYYFKPDSFVSAGFYEKRVQNFIGNSVVTKQLFGLRDPTAATPGTRSGTAKTQLQGLGADLSDVNLFTYTALLIQNGGNTAAATSQFLANYDATTRSLSQAFVDNELAAVDIEADQADPPFNFNVNTPINNKSAKIWGFEVAGQFFFGNSGIGLSGSYTLVRGNIGADIGADPTANQFALIGLSDTWNATLIYDKYGISARLSYNYRQKFLSELNRGGSHNPIFTAPYGQLDFNVSYDITPQLAVSVEGINLLEEGVHTYARSVDETYFLQEGSARYLVGLRFKF